MDIEAYIQSGSIEACVLGLASAEEMAELETLRRKYPSIDKAVIAFETELEKNATAGALMPPAFIKQQLTERLAAEFSQGGEAKVVGIPARNTVRPWKFMAAASVILFIGSAILNIYLYNRYQSADKRYTELLASQTTLMARNDVLNTRMNAMDESLRIITDPAMKQVSMPGATQGRNYIATVFWDTRTKDVYLLNNNLPAAPQGKQYQLWAIVDGKPVDAGMMDACTGLCRMKNIPRAEAFAITLEKQGGSPTPDLSQLYVMGKA